MRRRLASRGQVRYSARNGVRMRVCSRLLIVLLAAPVAGCYMRPTFTTGYTVPNAVPAAQPAERRLAVQRFEEARPPRHYHTSGRAFLVYVPLLPYVTLSYERLDEIVSQLEQDIITYHVHDMPDAPPFETYAYPASFPRAIAEDLRASGLFTTVDYVEDADATGYDYVLTGTLRATPLYNSGSSFMLGFPGVYLWLLPIPMQKTTAQVLVDVTLQDARTGDVVWRETLDSETSRIATMYNMALAYGSAGTFSFNLLPLQPDVTTVDRDSLFQWHFESLRRAMDGAKPRLASALAARQ